MAWSEAPHLCQSTPADLHAGRPSADRAVVGSSRLRRLVEPLRHRLLMLLPGVDLRIVADRKGDDPQP